jgi:hypothetical protein
MKGHNRINLVTVKGKQLAMDEVEFVDVEEDMSGRDLVTFKYEGQIYKSFVTTGYR